MNDFSLDSDIFTYKQEDDISDIQRLSEQKDNFSRYLKNSTNILHELHQKRQDLSYSIREKVLTAKNEELRHKKQMRKDVMKHFLNAKVFLRKEKYESVIQECEAALRIDDSFQDAKKVLEDATEELKKLNDEKKIKEDQQKEKEKEYKLLLFNAKKHIRKQEFSQALNLLEHSLKITGVSKEIQELIEKCEQSISEHKILEIREVEKQSKRDEEIAHLYSIANRFYKEQLLDKAKEFFNRILTLEPAHQLSLESLIQIEKDLKYHIDEQLKKEEECKRSIKRIEMECRNLARKNNFSLAFSKLESAIIEYNSNSLKDVLDELYLQEEKHKIFEQHKMQDSKNKIEQEIGTLKLREEDYLAGILKYESLMKDQKYDAAFLQMQMLLKEYSDKKELQLKKEEVLSLIFEQKKEERHQQMLEIEDQHDAVKNLGLARSCYYEGHFSEAKDICIKLVKINKYNVEDAEKLIFKCNEKEKILQNEMAIAAEKIKASERIQRKHEFMNCKGQFNKKLMNSEFDDAFVLLGDLKNYALDDDELKSQCSFLDKKLFQEIERYKQEKNQQEEKFGQLIKLAMEQYKNMQFQESYLNYKKALEIKPDDIDVLKLKDKSFLKITDIEKKEQEKKSLDNEAERAFEAFKIKLFRLETEGHFEEAFEESEKIAARFPGNEKIKEEIESLKRNFDTYSLEERSRKLKFHEDKIFKKNSLIKELIVKGQIELRKHNFDAAFKYFYEIMHLDPENKQIYDILDEAENLKSSYERKTSEENELKKLNKHNIEKLIFNAEKAVRSNDLVKALDFYEKSFEEDQRNVELKGIIIELEKKLNEQNSALRENRQQRDEQVKEWSLGATRCFFEKKYHEALSLCEKILLLMPENPKISDLKREILEEKKQRDLQDVEKTKIEEDRLRTEKEKNEMNEENRIAEIRSVHQAGLEFYRNNEYERAIEEWEKIKFIDPSNSVVSEEIRRAKLKMKEVEIINVQEKELKKQNDSKVNSLWLEGRYFFREGDYNKSIDAWEKAILITGRERRFIDGIEKSQTLLQKKKNEEERHNLIAEKRRKTLSNLVFLGNRYYNNAQYKEAIQYWEKALVIDPENVEIKNGILNAEDKIRMQIGDGKGLLINKSELESAVDDEFIGNDYSDGSVEKNNILPNEGLDT